MILAGCLFVNKYFLIQEEKVRFKYQKSHSRSSRIEIIGTMKLFLGYVGLVVGQSKGRESDDQVYQSNQVIL